MNPVQVIAVAVLSVVAASTMFPVAHNLRVGGPLDELQNYGMLAFGSITALLATLLPQLKEYLPKVDPKAAKGRGWISWLFGLAGSNMIGNATQVIAMVQDAYSDPDHLPNYFEGHFWYEGRSVRKLVYGSPPTTPAEPPKPVPVPTPVPAPAPKPVAPAPVAAT